MVWVLFGWALVMTGYALTVERRFSELDRQVRRHESAIATGRHITYEEYKW